MEIHRELGMGFKEIVYKEAVEYELSKHSIPYKKEKKFEIKYKDIILPHCFYADFIVYDEIVLEVKASSMIVTAFVSQTLNYLKASGLKLGIIANFAERSFISKRVIF